jgi:hypothetical protein
LSFLQLVFGKFGLLELCRLNLFNFCIKVLKIKRKLNSPPPSWAIDPYNNIIRLLIERGGGLGGGAEGDAAVL